MVSLEGPKVMKLTSRFTVVDLYCIGADGMMVQFTLLYVVVTDSYIHCS